jgi:hypothetical protein
MAFAAFLNAIFNRLLPFGTLLESTFPPLILLFGANLSQLATSDCTKKSSYNLHCTFIPYPVAFFSRRYASGMRIFPILLELTWV